MQVGYWFENVL